MGFVGRIEPRKGQLDLIAAFEHYHRRYSDSRLALVGPVADARYAAELKKLIRRNGLSSAVTIQGKVRNAYREMKKWALFVSMSKDEGQGLAVLEAMSLDVPVIARDAAGIRDYLRTGINGISLESTAPSVAAGRIEELMEDRNLAGRLVRGATRTVQAHFNWDQNVKRLNRLCGAA